MALSGRRELTTTSRNGTAKHAFDAEQPTGEIVRDEVLPRVARHAKALYTLAGIVAAIFLAGAGWATCSARYQTTAAAKEEHDRNTVEHEAMRNAIGANAKDIAKVTAIYGYIHDDIEGMRKQLDAVADKVHAEHVPEPKHGAQP